jgi:small-conductance mechanosensitive channel
MVDFSKSFQSIAQQVRSTYHKIKGPTTEIHTQEIDYAARQEGNDCVSDPDPQLVEKTFGRIISDHATVLWGEGESAVKGVFSEIENTIMSDFRNNNQ